MPTSLAPLAEEQIRIPSPRTGLELSLLHVTSPGTAGPPVLFLHGSTFPSRLAAGHRFDGRSWMESLASSGRDVWALDFHGYGDSDRYPEMAAPADANGPVGRAVEAADQIAAAVDLLRQRCGAKVSLVAHSWGTLAAGAYAAEHPEGLDRLIFFGPIGLPSATAPSVGGAPLAAWTEVTADQQRQRFLGYVPAGEGRVLPERHLGPWLQAYLATDRRSASERPPSVRVPNGPAADFAAVAVGAFPYDPSRLRTPLFIVRGAWDSLSPDDEVQRLLAAMTSVPVKRDIVLPRGTHVMHLEDGRTALHKAVEDLLPLAKGPARPFAVLFEARPRAECWDAYLATAASLRPRLEAMPGFLENVRYRSLRRPGWLLSVSRWADEQSLARWRGVSEHRAAQARGRGEIFEDYRIRVGQVGGPAVNGGGDLVSLWRCSIEEEAPMLPERLLAGAGLTPDDEGLTSWDAFLSLTDPRDCLLLMSWKAPPPRTPDLETVEVVRDYGMFDCRSAPVPLQPTEHRGRPGPASFSFEGDLG